MSRLYTNENVPREVVNELRILGHEVITSFEAGNANRGISDEDVLSFASRHDMVVVTNNRRDFIRLHHRFPNHGGIVVFTHDADFAGLAKRIHLALVEGELKTSFLARVHKNGCDFDSRT